MIEEANNALTFLLTSCLMCCLLGMESLGALIKLILCPATPYVIDTGFWGITLPISHLPEYCFYGVFAISAFGVALALKRSALEASITFGELVKSCFDLFRMDLLKKMAGEAALKDEWEAWARLRRSILVDRAAWLPEWEGGESEGQEQEKALNAEQPASHSRLDRVLVFGLTVAFLAKDVLCKGRSTSSRSDSRKSYVVLAQ